MLLDAVAGKRGALHYCTSSWYHSELIGVVDARLAVADGNSSRPATETEIQEALDLDNCNSTSLCSDELSEIRSKLVAQLNVPPEKAREQIQSMFVAGLEHPHPVVTANKIAVYSTSVSAPMIIYSKYPSPSRTTIIAGLARVTRDMNTSDREAGKA